MCIEPALYHVRRVPALYYMPRSVPVLCRVWRSVPALYYVQLIEPVR